MRMCRNASSPWPADADQVTVEQALADLVHQRAETRIDGGHAGGREGPTEHGTDLEHPALRAVEEVEPGEHRGLDRVGQALEGLADAADPVARPTCSTRARTISPA